MFKYIRKYKLSIIILGVLLIVLSSWYLLFNREIKEDPQRADLVYHYMHYKSMGDFYEN